MPRGVSKLLLLAILIPAAALAFTGPATPVFQFKWGADGSAPGQFSSPYAIITDAVGNCYVADELNHRIQKFDRRGNFILQWGSPGSGPGQFNLPIDVAVDKNGNVYVVDLNNYRVQKFTGSGAYVTQWGTAGTGNGQFDTPWALAVDGAGNVYVTDGTHRIQKFTGSGAFLTQWGTAGSGPGQFSAINSVTVDRSGNVYATDRSANKIVKFTNTGTYITQWGTSGSGDGQFLTPVAIRADDVGNIYVCDSNNSRIQKFTGSGTFLSKFGSSGTGNGQFSGVVGLTLDAAGYLYTCEISFSRIQKFSLSGTSVAEPASTYLLLWGSFGSGNGQFNLPRNVAFDVFGNVYVSDLLNQRIQKFSGTGAYLGQWGSLGSGNGQFNGPEGIAFDPSGGIFVVDAGNNRIQKFDSNGFYLLQWGSLGSGNGQFNSPYGVAVDAGGNVYVSDNLGHRIEKFSNFGAYITKWGGFGTGNGQFNNPTGVAVDPAGNVYVMDNGNSRIQVFTSTGSYITQWPVPNNPIGIAIDAFGNVYVADTGGNMIRKYTGNGTPLATWGGGGQFSQPWGVGVDAAGNVYVMDTSNSRVQKFVAPPAIALASDVGNDQGRQVKLRILRSSADSPGSGATVTGYEVYRRDDPLPGAAQATPPNSTQLDGWTYVGTAPAHGETVYNIVAPTLVDATAASLEFTAYMVRAATANPLVFFDSATETGYSVDNLPPPAPAPLTAAYAMGATHLHWGESPAADFATFRVYRGSSPGFVPGAGNLVTAISDTGYADPGAAGSYYQVSAVDINGNEGPFSLVGPGQTTDTKAAGAAEFALGGVWPNPAHGDRLSVDFALPSSEPARVELIDVTGRRVVERAVGTLGAGRHTVDLAQGKRLPPGIYLVRLTQGPRCGVTRITVLN